MKTQEYIRMFGTADGKRLLQKALTSNIASGGAAIQEPLEVIITNEMIRLVPELAIVEMKWDSEGTHRFTRLTSLPAAGSAMGESSVTPTRQSAMTKATVDLKVLKRKGSVTGFLRAAARKNYDMVEVETENHIQAFANDIATYFLYGNKGADAYTFDGLDYFIKTKRVNETWGGVVPTDMSPMDNLLDASNRKKGQPHRRVYEMSPELLTTFSNLYTSVRDQRTAIREGTNMIQIDGGWRLQTYRGVPIIESTQTSPQGQMGAVSAGHAGGGSAIPDNTRYFQVAPVTWDGEQIASAQVSDTSSSSDTITLTFSAYENALFYKVYVGTISGQATLKKIVSAFTYDGAGTPTGSVTSIVFTSEPLTAHTASVPTHMQADKPFNYTGGIAPEILLLWDLDPYQGMGKVVYSNEDGGRLDGLATIIPLAKVDDTDDFLLKAYMALIDAFEATCGMHRGLRRQ